MTQLVIAAALQTTRCSCTATPPSKKVAELTAKNAALEERARGQEKTSDRGWQLWLAALGFGFQPKPYDLILMGFVTVFTLVSVSLYLVEWVRHMSTIEAS